MFTIYKITFSQIWKKQPTDSQNSVQQLPKAFTKWAKDNQQHITKAKSLPYFIKDNFIQNKDGSLFPLIGYSCNTTELKAFKKKARELLANKTFRDNITLSNRSIKEWLNQPHKYKKEKDKAIFHIAELLNDSQYIGNGIDKHDPQIIVHLYRVKLGDEYSHIVVREFKDGVKNVHSISDSQNIVNKIIKNPSK